MIVDDPSPRSNQFVSLIVCSLSAQVVKDMGRRKKNVEAVVEEVTKKDVVLHRAIGWVVSSLS